MEKPPNDTGARAKSANELRAKIRIDRDVQGASEVDPPTLVPQRVKQTRPSRPREAPLLVLKEASRPTDHVQFTPQIREYEMVITITIT